MKSRSVFFLTVAVIAVSLYATAAWAQTRWSEQKANSWYAQQPWLVGSNYVPKSAINQLEMWQETTFNPAEIDQELTWAERIGMNTMRVFLHDLLWQQRVLDDRLAASYSTDVRALRFLLGPDTSSRTAASADSRSPQLRLGAKSRSKGSGGRQSISPAEIIRAGSGAGLRAR
jgi:hypothetical protein